MTRLFDRDGIPNQRADSLLALNHAGSLAHYFFEMSNEALTLAPPTDGINTTWFESLSDSVGVYVPSPTCNNRDVNTWGAAVRRFVGEVIQEADNEIDFSDSEFDRNNDDMVDLVIVVVPRDFGRRCGPNGTIFTAADFSPRLSVDGVGIQAIITTEFRPSMPWLAGVLAHEYGHVMGLPELFDRSHMRSATRGSHPEHSAGLGRWGVMAGAFGWPHVEERDSGPNPLSVWSRMEVGWLTPVSVTADMLDVRIHDVNSTNGRVYRLPVSSSEYFLVANRQNGYPTVGSYYDSLAPASGLAIWHVDENSPVPPGRPRDVNDDELHKRVDLECADGLYSDRGHPSTMPDAVAGRDNLDFWAADSTYRANNNGHDDRGDATDLWNGPTGDLTTDTAFTPYTNPSTAGYNGNQQNVRTGIAVRDIQALPGGVMQADFHLNYWTGSIATNTTWSDTVTVGGDVTVASGATLRLARGTLVRFLANTDDTGGGTDTTLSELIVSGTLDADAGGIVFGSTNAEADTAEWYGLRVLSGGSADLTGASLRDGVRCAQNAGTLTLSNTRFSDCGLLAGADSVSYAENGTGSVAVYAATDPSTGTGLSTATWSTAGTDASAFTFSGGTLSFASAPDFERPSDGGRDNRYELAVRAAAGSRFTASKSVVVQVTDGDDPGRVSLSTTAPQVGRELQAVVEDEDGVKNLRWNWYPVSERKGASVSGTAPTTGEGKTTPGIGLLGKRLQAQATYNDGHGEGKQAVSDTTAAVTAGPPSAPVLTAQAGDGRVVLSWSAADSNGAWVTAYSLRDSIGGAGGAAGSGGSWTNWIAVPGKGAARDTTRTGLTNGRQYTFEVRAKNTVGDGDSSRVSATPARPRIAGADSVRYAENRTDTVASYRVTPPGDAVPAQGPGMGDVVADLVEPLRDRLLLVGAGAAPDGNRRVEAEGQAVAKPAGPQVRGFVASARRALQRLVVERLPDVVEDLEGRARAAARCRPPARTGA